jgi:hypothetical protein
VVVLQQVEVVVPIALVSEFCTSTLDGSLVVLLASLRFMSRCTKLSYMLM